MASPRTRRIRAVIIAAIVAALGLILAGELTKSSDKTPTTTCTATKGSTCTDKP